LWTTRRPAWPRIAAARRVVVVLPLVPVTTTEPSRSAAPSLASERRSTHWLTCPGSVVPPPRPSRRLRSPLSLPATLAAVSRAADRLGLAEALGGTLTAAALQVLHAASERVLLDQARLVVVGQHLAQGQQRGDVVAALSQPVDATLFA